MRYGWVDVREEWDRLEAICPDLKWRKVLLSSNHKSSVTDKAGIYIIAAPPPGEAKRLAGGKLYNAVYIGQATNIATRFSDHCVRPSPAVARIKRCWKGRLDFWFSIVDEERLDEVEALMIDCFGPTANLQSGAKAIKGKVGAPVPA